MHGRTKQDKLSPRISNPERPPGTSPKARDHWILPSVFDLDHDTGLDRLASRLQMGRSIRGRCL